VQPLLAEFVGAGGVHVRPPPAAVDRRLVDEVDVAAKVLDDLPLGHAVAGGHRLAVDGAREPGPALAAFHDLELAAVVRLLNQDRCLPPGLVTITGNSLFSVIETGKAIPRPAVAVTNPLAGEPDASRT